MDKESGYGLNLVSLKGERVLKFLYIPSGVLPNSDLMNLLICIRIWNPDPGGTQYNFLSFL
jgi:hypothetical protein